MPRILQPTEQAIAEAAAVLRGGGAVALPTETVYGLAADTFNESAIARVYELKGRPAGNPLIAHVLDEAGAKRLAAQWDQRCRMLAQRFWPGPLTLVLPRRDEVPAIACGGRGTIAVRSPAHPVARAVLERCGLSLSAPSANRSGHVSPTTARHVAADFAEVADLLILDGGACEIGLESTVLDLSGARARVLRPGTVTAAMLRGLLGEVDEPAARSQGISPGTSLSHYAPRTPVELLELSALRERLGTARGRCVVLAIEPASVPQPHELIAMPRDAAAYAERLYAALREADSRGASRIVIELPPQRDGLWLAIHDRMTRAASRGG